MKKQVEAWIKFADTDLLTVSEIIERPELMNVAAFHCQQAIEKYFKAFILKNEKPLVKIHNLLKVSLFIHKNRFLYGIVEVKNASSRFLSSTESCPIAILLSITEIGRFSSIPVSIYD
ncbi:MAG: HEPN domain-containing protein [Leptospirales bacterium]|nr:HEPN domain-containing protein [Leptospirales bacterium]